MNFLSLKQTAFGLDISDLSVKIVKLKKKNKYLELASLHEFELEPGIIRGGEIKDSEALIKILRQNLSKVKGERLRTQKVIASLPEEKSFTQVIQMPIMDKDELRNAVVYEAENYVPLDISEVYLDFQTIKPVYNHLDHIDVLIAALPKRTVDSYLKVLKGAGLKPLVFEIESQAITQAVVKGGMTPERLLIIDLGASRTGVMIFSGFSLRFTSSVPISGAFLDRAIAKRLHVSLKEAEKLKIRYGLDEKHEVAKILKPILHDVALEVKKYLEYYYSHIGHEHLAPNGKTMERILLCGGGANLKGLINFFSKEFKVPVKLANPWVNILANPAKGHPNMPLKKSLEYTTALGLALRGANHD
jgi:type IV pilus assembly protein PilM